MKLLQRWKGIVSALCLALFVMAVAGCGSDSHTAAPAALTGVTATAGDSQVSLNWTTTSTATSYNVYYSTSANVSTATATKVGNLTGPGSVTGLSNGSTYHFVVTAVNAGGESPVSNEVSAMPVPPVPAKPTGISLSPGDALVNVSWTAQTDAVSYNIYYSTSATLDNSTKITGATSGQDVSSLTNATLYYFAVTAVNLGGESLISTIKSATPAPQVQTPTNPSNLGALAGAGQATVTWGPVANATSYNLYYLQSAGTPTGATVFSTGTKVANVTTPWVVGQLTTGLNYFFVVTAVNSAGESSPQTNAKKATIL